MVEHQISRSVFRGLLRSYMYIYLYIFYSITFNIVDDSLSKYTIYLAIPELFYWLVNHILGSLLNLSF